LHKVSANRVLPYSIKQLLSLAADVSNYSQFLPWVKAVRIWNKSTDNKEFDAELMIGYKNFRVPFSTHVIIDDVNNMIKTKNIDDKKGGFLGLKSPIRNLDCVWSFQEIDGNSQISVDISIDFRDFIIGSLVGANLDIVTNKLISQFVLEADKRFA
jgi:coenzyme Q-binding protein COQ10